MPLHYQILIGLAFYAFGLVLICLFNRNAHQLSHCDTDGDLIPDQHTEDPDHSYYGSDSEPEWKSSFAYEMHVKNGVARIIPIRRNA